MGGGVPRVTRVTVAQEEQRAGLVAAIASELEGYVPGNAAPAAVPHPPQHDEPDAGGADRAAGAGGKADVWATCDAKRKGVVNYAVAPGNLVNAAKKAKRMLDGLESGKSLKLNTSHRVWTCSFDLLGEYGEPWQQHLGPPTTKATQMIKAVRDIAQQGLLGPADFMLCFCGRCPRWRERLVQELQKNGKLWIEDRDERGGEGGRAGAVRAWVHQ